MAFQTNIEILKKAYPEAAQSIASLGDHPDDGLVKVVSRKKGGKTLKVGEKYIHELEDPIQEAKDFIQQYKNVQDHSDILFYGIGLGYHIDAFLEQYPNTRFSIYEPVPEVFRQFLRHADLSQIPAGLLKKIYIEDNLHDPEVIIGGIVNKIRKSILIIDLPAYRDIFPEKHRDFFSRFENRLNERRISLATVSTFEKRWTINSTRNFIHILNSTDILLEKKAAFKNKPALLVASGPSLEEEMDNLRLIKENGLAYIFSAGTAVNSLVQNGIHPDAACTYDPTDENQIVCKEVLKRGVNSIPLIFGSTVGYETLEKYPGPKMHVLIHQDSLAAFYLKPLNKENLEFVNDAATITVVSLQLLYKLGFNPIILVGQNLAYRENKNYASGSTYPSRETGRQESGGTVPVKDVYGNSVYSNTSYIRMRKQIESYLEKYNDIEVINTTKYGAHIEGSKFAGLEEVIRTRLQNRVVEKNCWDLGKCSYDMEYLTEQSSIINDDFDKGLKLLEKCKSNLDGIKELTEGGDHMIIQQGYARFNQSMENLRNNRFFAAFIIPMNRVELQGLILAAPDISKETDPALKARLMEKHFRPYLLNCERDFHSIGPLFHEMNQSVQQFYKKNIVRRKSAGIKILLADCDGVLTDGAVYYSALGDEIKKFSYKDLAGISLLQRKGVQTVIISPEVSTAIKNIAEKLGIQAIFSKDKKVTMATVMSRYGLDFAEVACIFNDLCDLAVVKQAGLSFAVNNASEDLRHVVDYVLAADGGRGAILEMSGLFF